SPSGPDTIVVRLAPPRTSSVPSPPSASGISSHSQPVSSAARRTAAATSAAVAVPRSLSGAATTRTPSWCPRGRGYVCRMPPGPPDAGLPGDRPLIVVSNRGPVAFELDGGTLRAKRGGGGLV